jgi:hypothetical protein
MPRTLASNCTVTLARPAWSWKASPCTVV